MVLEIYNDANIEDIIEKSGDKKTKIFLDELILELDENIRNKFINLDKEIKVIIKFLITL